MKNAPWFAQGAFFVVGSVQDPTVPAALRAATFGSKASGPGAGLGTAMAASPVPAPGAPG
jgi:hypothetical protein